jgi:hypothetical protein
MLTTTKAVSKRWPGTKGRAGGCCTGRSSRMAQGMRRSARKRQLWGQKCKVEAAWGRLLLPESMLHGYMYDV